MAVHSAQRGGAQLVALGQARALRREYDLVVAVGAGPLRAAFAEVATAVVRGPTCLPIWGASHRRWALQIGRAVPDAVRFAGLVRRHRIDVVVVNSTVLVAPVLGARLARVPVIVHAQEAPTSAAATRLFRVPRSAGGHGRGDLAVDRPGIRRRTRERPAESRRHPDPARSGAAGAVRGRSGPRSWWSAPWTATSARTSRSRPSARCATGGWRPS